jgi:hypothetical protein
MRKFILGLIAISLSSCAAPPASPGPPGESRLRFSQKPTMAADMQACKDTSNGLMRMLIVCMEGKGYQSYYVDNDGFQFSIGTGHNN